jgi:hypothetical protein
MREASGVMTKDGQWGMVWTTNVLSTYVMVSPLVIVILADKSRQRNS